MPVEIKKNVVMVAFNDSSKYKQFRNISVGRKNHNVIRRGKLSSGRWETYGIMCRIKDIESKDPKTTTFLKNWNVYEKVMSAI